MKQQTALMVDLETLSSHAPDALIVSIGAVAFDLFGSSSVDALCADGFKRLVELKQPDRRLDPETVVWWMGQVKEGEDKLLEQFTGPRTSMMSALIDLSVYTLSLRCKTVWAYAPTFDLAILRHAYDQFQMPVPWGWKDERDARTLARVTEDLKGRFDVPENPLKHDPLYDAAVQAVAVQNAVRKLRE
jgi:hypothetical protein